MAIQNVSGNSDIQEYKTPDDIDLKPADIYNSQKIGNVLSGIEKAVDRDIVSALEDDGQVTGNEVTVLQKWLDKSKKIYDSISGIVSKTYEGYCTRFETVIKNIEKYTKIPQTENAQLTETQSDEPVETDAAYSRDEYIKKQAYAYMKAVEEATNKLADPNLSSVERAELFYKKTKLMSEYTEDIEEASEIKLFRDYCNEYANNKRVVTKNKDSKVHTPESGDALGDVVSPGYGKRRKADEQAKK